MMCIDVYFQMRFFLFMKNRRSDVLVYSYLFLLCHNMHKYISFCLFHFSTPSDPAKMAGVVFPTSPCPQALVFVRLKVPAPGREFFLFGLILIKNRETY